MVSGLPPTTIRAIHTRFRSAFAPEGLKLAVDGNSPVHHAKGTRSVVAPSENGAIDLPLLVGIRFQVLLTPLTGFFSSFGHPTGALSVAK